MYLRPIGRIVAAVITRVAFSTALFAGSAGKFTEESIWMLADRANDIRWVEIHKIDGVGAEALYHISVLSRHKTDPVWNLKHIVAHMAITGRRLVAASFVWPLVCALPIRRPTRKAIRLGWHCAKKAMHPSAKPA
jgi:hypothetical protein